MLLFTDVARLFHDNNGCGASIGSEDLVHETASRTTLLRSKPVRRMIGWRRTTRANALTAERLGRTSIVREIVVCIAVFVHFSAPRQ
jgi:hypothetical protein